MSNWQNSKPVLGSQINWNHPLAKGLVGCWLFNEGAGNQVNNLTKLFNSNRGFNTKFKNDYLYFNAASFVITPYNNKFDFNTEYSLVTYSLSLSPNAYSNIILKIKDGTGYSLNVSGDSRWQLVAYQSGNPIDIYANITPNKFDFIVGTQSISSGLKIYKNGILASSYPNYKIVTGTSDLIFGVNSSLVGSYFDGYCKLNLLYNRALSSSEVKDLYISPYQFIYKPRKVFYSIPTGVTTWGHKIWGILNANIGKVNQVDKANIEKVNRV